MPAHYVETLEHVDPADLHPYPGNAKLHDTDALAESFGDLAQYRSVVARRLPDGQLQLLAGHGTTEAIAAAGQPVRVEVITVDTDDEALRVVLNDNGTGARAGYDEIALLALLDRANAAGGLHATGYDEDLYAELLDRVGSENPHDWQPDTDTDDIPEVPEEPVTQLGDAWELGRHRLICGDSMAAGTHKALFGGGRPGLIYTDPPYGMDLQTDYTKVGHGGGKVYKPVAGDDRAYDPTPLITRYSKVAEQFWWGADYYRASLPAGGSWIVWDKRDNDAGMNLDELFGASFELCWSRQQHKREIARILWAMTHGQQRPEEDAKRGLHPTQKPVALALWFLERWAKPNTVVADFYAGAGSTLIAAEMHGCQARCAELDPGYCDVIARRWQTLTGGTPLLNGEPVDLMRATADD